MFCVHLPNGDCDVVHLSFFVVTAKAEDQNQERGSENQLPFSKTSWGVGRVSPREGFWDRY